MKKDTIVTLDEQDKWYLSDETSQNGNKYFLALKVDENEKPLDESKIFMEEIDGDDIYLVEVEDEETLKYLGAVFISNFRDIVNE